MLYKVIIGCTLASLLAACSPEPDSSTTTASTSSSAVSQVLEPPPASFPEPAKPAETAKPDSPLLNTYWKLTELQGEVVSITEGRREPHLVLHEESQRLAGSDGCNNIMGSYSLKDNQLNFGQMASTKMACPEGGEQADKFGRILQDVTHFNIHGDTLELRNPADELLAAFTAVALH